MNAKLQAALTIAGIRLYANRSGDPTYDAQRNLEGRTHYVDADTMRYFKSRILSARPMANGLAFYLVESVASRPNHGGYNKRFVCFDVFGTTFDTRDEWFRTSEQAYKAGMKAMDAINLEKHTADELKRRAKRDIETARATIKALGR